MPVPVVLVTYYNAFGTGGMETHIVRLAQGLSKLGHRGTLITPADPAVLGVAPSALGNFAVRVVPPAVEKWFPWHDALQVPRLLARYWRRDARIVLETLDALRHDDARVLYVPGPVNLPSTATLNVLPFWQALRVFRRTRVVLGARGAASHWYGRPVMARLFSLEERAQLRFADAVTVVDHYYAQALFPAEHRAKYVVIPNGVDPDRFRPTPGPDAAVVTFVGRLTPDRGVDVFLDAVEALRGVRASFRIVGDGPIREAVLARLRERSLPVEWLGGISHDRMPEVYAASSVVVNPSPVEGIGNITLEAMACGRCVVRTASRYGEFAIRDGENGLTFPRGDPRALADRIRRTIEDPALAARLGIAARETVLRSFTVDAEARAYSDLFEALAART